MTSHTKKQNKWFFKTHSNKIDIPLANPNENKGESRQTILEIKRDLLTLKKNLTTVM